MDSTSSTTASVPESQKPPLAQQDEQVATSAEDAALDEQDPADSEFDEYTAEDEIEDELIIEDFTIDGICGVY